MRDLLRPGTLGIEAFVPRISKFQTNISNKRGVLGQRQQGQMASAIPQYPWFGVVEGDDIEQGDILEEFPIVVLPDKLVFDEGSSNGSQDIQWQKLDLVVMSQTCDLVKGREKIDDVLLCAVWKRSELSSDPHLGTADGMENARMGRLPAYHVLADCNVSGLEREVRIVDFRRVFSMPLPFVRSKLASEKRIRVLPPYREHLSQSFARFFMRVGLPADIPSFKKKK